ncbi:hypothetical protein [Polaromonas sp. CG9_12]|nr:hypothetical protein [Polaromonas sp. CG9_12]
MDGLLPCALLSPLPLLSEFEAMINPPFDAGQRYKKAHLFPA